MVDMIIPIRNPLFPFNKYPSKHQILFPSKPKIHYSQNPNNTMKEYQRRKPHIVSSVIISPGGEIPLLSNKSEKDNIFVRNHGFLEVGNQEMSVLCGLGYFVNGVRGFPWLALNFHMAHNLNMHPSTLQLVQISGNLPTVAKPLYGILSDILYIGGAHRIPYISVGVFLQVLSWGSLALIPIVSEACAPLMACILLSNLGASIEEVAKDALLTEYGQKNKTYGLQSYALMASAIGGVIGNLVGGFFLLKSQQTKSMFLAFAGLLSLQLTTSLTTREDSLGLNQKSITHSINKQYLDLTEAIKKESISCPLLWLVSSILITPMLSGSLFCYQTQCLNLNPLVIGMSKATGQFMLLSLSILYNRFGKNIPMRKLATIVQILYALALLLDLLLVKQINLQLGISNEVFTLCFSGLAENIAQFKLLPFSVLLASLAPPGCEGSLMSCLACALCLSSIFSGFLGVGLASFLGITSGDYSSLPLAIVVQFCAALLPLCWIGYVPMSQIVVKKRDGTGSKRMRANRRVVFDSMYSYRPERESDLRR